MITLSRRGLLAGAAALPAAVILGCGDDNSRDVRTIRTPVTVLTSFGHLGRDAYLHHTMGTGLWADAGLDVTLEPGTGTGDNVTALAGGQAQMAASDTMAMIVTQGETPTGVVLLGLVQQHNLTAIMARASAISHPRDLEGRVLGLPPGSASELMWQPWAEQVGVDTRQVRVEPVPPPQLVSALASGQVDAIGQFVVGEPLVAAAVGDQLTVLPYAEDLTDALGVGLWCPRQLAEEQPDLVRAWRDATLLGLADALARPEQAAGHVADVAPETNVEVAAAELELMRPYVGDPIGEVDMQTLSRAIALMHTTGALPVDTTLTPEDLTMPGITLAVQA